MPAQLLSLNDGPSILLDKPILLFGRDLECDIRLDSRKISRRHCCIAQVGEQLIVRDLGSTNGVRVNGARVIEGYLKAGDELTIGNFRYQIRWDAISEGGLDKEEKQVARHGSTDRAPDEDDLLEECDEPVPLEEPDDGPPVANVPGSPVKPSRPLALPSMLEGQPQNAAPPDEQRGTQILPDDLELAPSSNLLKKASAEPPPDPGERGA